jgi:DNA-binding transcriptional regulator YiaG
VVVHNFLEKRVQLHPGELFKIKPVLSCTGLVSREIGFGFDIFTIQAKVLHKSSESSLERLGWGRVQFTKYHLATALIQAREAAGHSQSSLAQLGVQQSLVSKWEHINHNHALETLLNLSRATGAKLVLGLEVDGKLIPVES